EGDDPELVGEEGRKRPPPVAMRPPAMDENEAPAPGLTPGGPANCCAGDIDRALFARRGDRRVKPVWRRRLGAAKPREGADNVVGVRLAHGAPRLAASGRRSYRIAAGAGSRECSFGLGKTEWARTILREF